MLTRSFIHIPRIGPKRERNLWEMGIISWDDYLNDKDLFGSGPPVEIENALLESKKLLDDRKAVWFENLLGATHSWRLAHDFDHGQIAYLDIESDNVKRDDFRKGPHEIGGTTVVSVWDGKDGKIFLRDKNLDDIPKYLNRYPVLCTFNGKLFDLPYLENKFGKGFYEGAHLDLRPITRAVGLTGGLKKIEMQIGISRPKDIADLNGYDAVKLWRAYRKGNLQSLKLLAKYNLYDAVNLQAVLRESYNQAVAQGNFPFRRFDFLTEPGTVKTLSELLRSFSTPKPKKKRK